MNKVKTKKSENKDPKQGDIFMDVHNEEYYMLCIVEDEYCCVSLNDGCHWNGTHKMFENATEGLKFVCSQPTITIEY